VTVRLKTPSTQAHFEQWAAIMERVEGDVYDVDELAHLIQDDADSVWPLASRGEERPGLRRRSPVLDRRKPLRDGSRPPRAARVVTPVRTTCERKPDHARPHAGHAGT
jgi:hypothetical protein